MWQPGPACTSCLIQSVSSLLLLLLPPSPLLFVPQFLSCSEKIGFSFGLPHCMSSIIIIIHSFSVCSLYFTLNVSFHHISLSPRTNKRILSSDVNLFFALLYIHVFLFLSSSIRIIRNFFFLFCLVFFFVLLFFSIYFFSFSLRPIYSI